VCSVCGAHAARLSESRLSLLQYTRPAPLHCGSRHGHTTAAAARQVDDGAWLGRPSIGGPSYSVAAGSDPEDEYHRMRVAPGADIGIVILVIDASGGLSFIVDRPSEPGCDRPPQRSLENGRAPDRRNLSGALAT